jgi:hypothetical protein
LYSTRCSIDTEDCAPTRSVLDGDAHGLTHFGEVEIVEVPSTRSRGVVDERTNADICCVCRSSAGSTYFGVCSGAIGTNESARH